jgi:hypothetical protein
MLKQQPKKPAELSPLEAAQAALQAAGDAMDAWLGSAPIAKWVAAVEALKALAAPEYAGEFNSSGDRLKMLARERLHGVAGARSAYGAPDSNVKAIADYLTHIATLPPTPERGARKEFLAASAAHLAGGQPR